MARRVSSSRGNRRPELLAAARRLFFNQGYAKTTMEQVAGAAGFSKRTVYLYFKNKDDLFISVAAEGIEILQSRLEAMDVDHLSLDALIEKTMEIYTTFAASEPRYFSIIFRDTTAEMIGNAASETQKRVAGQERACLGVVADIVERGIAAGTIPPVDPWETAVIFWGMATGIILLSLGGSQTIFGRRTREDLISKATWLLYAGIMRPGPGPGSGSVAGGQGGAAVRKKR